jgi:prepilin-type N-terminal cleavage/methylation domain-containing protein
MESDPILGERGFTLVEMLVVLLIVGMAGGLLFEGAAQVMNMQTRFGSQLASLRGEALRADWLRQAVEGLQPDYTDGKQVFKGTARGFSGLTTNPLSADYGGLAAFAVVLQQDALRNQMVLRYGAEKDAPEILRWAGDQGRLRYVDNKGEPHEDWPPLMGLWPQLPTAIYLEGWRDGAPWQVVATPYGPTWPVPRPIDLMRVVP